MNVSKCRTIIRNSKNLPGVSSQQCLYSFHKWLSHDNANVKFVFALSITQIKIQFNFVFFIFCHWRNSFFSILSGKIKCQPISILFKFAMAFYFGKVSLNYFVIIGNLENRFSHYMCQVWDVMIEFCSYLLYTINLNRPWLELCICVDVTIYDVANSTNRVNNTSWYYNQIWMRFQFRVDSWQFKLIWSHCFEKFWFQLLISLNFSYGANTNPTDGGSLPIIALLDKLLDDPYNQIHVEICLKILLKTVPAIEMPYKVGWIKLKIS